MRDPRFGPCAEVKRVVLVPLSDRMRMSPQETGGTIALGRKAAQPAHFIDLQVSEYPMMMVHAVARCEQAKEKKHIADADAVPL